MNKLKGKSLLIDRTNARSHSYAEAARKVSAEFSLPCLDLWRHLEGESEARQLYLSDGLHLSALGNAKLFDALKDLIYSAYPAWSIDRMPLDQPDWAEMGEMFKAK